MQAFLVKVVVAALLQLTENPQFQGWVKGLMAEGLAEVKADMTGAVTDLENTVEGLPARIVGDAEASVKGLLGSQTGDITGVLAPLSGAISKLTDLINNFNPLHWGQ